MNKLNLDHELTPEKLKKINAELETVFRDDNLETELLLSLITQRDECVTAHLSSLNDEQKKAFSELEMPTNKSLLARATSLHKQSLNELSGLIKGQKAVKKYE